MNRDNKGMKLGIFGICGNLFLSCLKVVIGIIANSVALIGDAFNNMTDLLSSCVNFVSFKVNKKPADKEHPYGHKRSEYIGGLLISAVILFVAFELALSGVKEIINPTAMEITFWIWIILGCNVAIKATMAVLYHLGYRKINSISLKASFRDSISDILINAIIVIGLFISKWSGYNLDGYLSVLLAIVIFLSGIGTLKEAISKLIGEPLRQEIVEKITSDVLVNNEILGVHDVLTHNYGEDTTFMSLHVEMDAKIGLLEAHRIIDRIERTTKEKYGVQLLIHIDPIDFSDDELSKIRRRLDEIVESIGKELEYHDLQMSKGKDKRIYFDLSLPFTLRDKTKDIIDEIKNELSKKFPYKISIEISYK